MQLAANLFQSYCLLHLSAKLSAVHFGTSTFNINDSPGYEFLRCPLPKVNLLSN